MDDLQRSTEFEWDEGNQEKNLLRHGVHWQECEEAFFDPERKVYPDPRHAHTEKRYLLLGKTLMARLLFIVFAIRRGRIRIISARDLNKREYPLYEKEA